MKRLFTILCLAALTFTACQKEPAGGDENTGKKGILILNNGNMKSNDSSLSLYNPGDRTVEAGVFLAANGQKLGDLGQDMLLNGDDIYIAVNNSQVIFVTDRELAVKKQIVAKNGDCKLSPRSLMLHGSKVYVTYYEGFLGEIDPAKDYAVRTTAVGSSPEGLAYAAGKIYVANSGGAMFPNFANTVSVVDAASFKEVSTIDVNLNPQKVAASEDGSMLYVSSFGDYGDTPAKLQSIRLSDSRVTDLEYANVQTIAAAPGNLLYVVTGAYDENWQIQGSINVFDMKTAADKGKFCSQDIEKFYSISCDPVTGNVFAGSSNYVTNGDLYMFDKTGKLIDKVDTQGLNPIKAICLQ